MLELCSRLSDFFGTICLDLFLDYDLLCFVLMYDLCQVWHIVLRLLSSLAHGRFHVFGHSSTGLCGRQVLFPPADCAVQVHCVAQ